MAGNHSAAVFAWREHTAARRTITDSTLLTALIHAYPDYHVTRTRPSKCDVLGYAAAGFATATPCEDAAYDAYRVYSAPASKMSDEEGKLKDKVSFGKVNYEHDGDKFIVYEARYRELFGDVVKLQFVLAPRTSDDSISLHNSRTDKLLLAAGAWTQAVHEQIWVYEDADWSKNHELWQSVQGATWNDIVLEPAMRAKLHRDIHGFFDTRDVYRRAKIPWKRGIILHGVPGNGKSMTLAVTINELTKRSPPVPALYVKSLDSCAGHKSSLQEIFEKARQTAPCLLVLEDLDSLVTDNTRSYFLNEVDGLASNDGILIIGSTNYLDRLDPSVTKRPSRFDRKYHFKLPGESERLAYCRYWRSKFVAEDSELLNDFTEELCDILAKWTEGFSFAYMKELFVAALLLHTNHEGEEDEVGVADGDKPKTNGAAANYEVSGLPKKSVDAKQDSATNGQPGDESTKPQEEEKKPSKLPGAPIPNSLQDSRLLQIFRTQAQTLLEEIDHTAGPTDAKPKAAEGEPPFRYKPPSLLND